MAALLGFLLLVGCGSPEQPSRRMIDPAGATLLGQAQHAYTQANYVRALGLLDSAEAFVPDVPDLWFLRGVVLTEMYRFSESNAALEEAGRLDPTYRSVRFNMGHNAFLQSSVFARNDYHTALRHYHEEEALLRQAVQAGEEQKSDLRGLSAVLVQIGTTYAHLNAPDSARQAFEKAIELDSTNASAVAYLASLQQEVGQYEQALVNARKASRLESRNAEHRLLVGMLLHDLGRNGEALTHLEEVVEARPWDQTAAYTLGRVLLELDRREAALQQLARADTLEKLQAAIQRSHMRVFRDPTDPIRWENYAYLLHQAGRESEAQKAVSIMRTLASKDSL